MLANSPIVEYRQNWVSHLHCKVCSACYFTSAFCSSIITHSHIMILILFLFICSQPTSCPHTLSLLQSTANRNREWWIGYSFGHCPFRPVFPVQTSFLFYSGRSWNDRQGGIHRQIHQMIPVKVWYSILSKTGNKTIRRNALGCEILFLTFEYNITTYHFWV